MDDDRLAKRLIECEQELAAQPELEQRLGRALAENEALRVELAAAHGALHEVTASPSWRVTQPLRWLRQLGRRSA